MGTGATRTLKILNKPSNEWDYGVNISKKLLGKKNPQNAAHVKSIVSHVGEGYTCTSCENDKSSPLMFNQFAHPQGITYSRYSSLKRGKRKMVRLRTREEMKEIARKNTKNECWSALRSV
jgi:hypothetical protein